MAEQGGTVVSNEFRHDLLVRGHAALQIDSQPAAKDLSTRTR